MSYDVQCPYCRMRQEINHDDGYGYEEDVEYTQHCKNCGRTFKYFTNIIYSYDSFCDPEEQPHELEQTFKGLWECKNCDYYE